VRVDGDAFVDLRTGRVTPLPAAITSLGETNGYVVAPGGDVLLFKAHVDGSVSNQIFIAGVDGSNVRQLTDSPGGAAWDAWSLDGATIVALVGENRMWSRRGGIDLVLVDVETGGTTVLASGPSGDFWKPHFGVDGQLILFGMDVHEALTPDDDGAPPGPRSRVM
jgi:Tol biopolymer transport system component